MKKIFHLVLFLLAFQIEVRVKASEAVSIPEDCVGKTYPCSFKVTTAKWSYAEGNVKLHAPYNTILVENKKAKNWKLIDGTLWVQNAPSTVVQTNASEVEGSSGQYWVFVKKDRVVYRNISSKLIVTFKDQSKMEIPKGFEVWVGTVNSEAKVDHGMVEPVDLKSHLKSWYELYPGKREQFVSEVQDLKDQWADLIEQSGHIYKQVAERKLASIDEEKQKKINAQKKAEEERLRIRAEFHKRVFEN